MSEMPFTLTYGYYTHHKEHEDQLTHNTLVLLICKLGTSKKPYNPMTLVEIISSQLIMMATNRIKGTPKLSQHATLEEMSFLLSPKPKHYNFIYC